jgi:DNA-binding XRE family transcriptional regulator
MSSYSVYNFITSETDCNSVLSSCEILLSWIFCGGKEGTEMLLAERLRMLRAQKDWTLDELAVRAGVSRITIHRAERGSQRITAPIIMALAKALNVPTDYLLGMDEDDKRRKTKDRRAAAVAMVGA